MESTKEFGAASSHISGAGRPVPGILLVFSAGQPCLVAARLDQGPVEIGRQENLPLSLKDSSVSRLHTRVTYDRGSFTVTDLGSKNGTFVDGQRLNAPGVGPELHVLRIGASVFLLSHDIRPYTSAPIECADGRVIGPTLRPAVERTRRIGRAGQDLHLTGETGVGKEIFARLYHAASVQASGPFVAVNCATIPKELAESMLFGAKRGAYTGAHTDQPGLFRTADGGTLFLDELGELDVSLQAKLLRVLETREVTPVGSVHAQPIKVQVCSATLRDLRERVRLGQFREDLYFRVARPCVAIPALRDRLEEIAWLMQQAMSEVSAALQLTPVLVEACLARAWPGNVRELLAAVRDASHAAVEAGSSYVKLTHLDSGAGLAFGSPLGEKAHSPVPLNPAAAAALHPPAAAAHVPAPAAQQPPGAAPAVAPAEDLETRPKVEALLRRTAGNVSRTARLLGWHRTQLRRFLEREGIDPQAFSGIDDDTP